MNWTADDSALAAALFAGLSAIFAGGSFWLYWRELRKRERASDPICELTAKWDGEFASLQLTARNNWPFVAEILSVTIFDPRDAKITGDMAPADPETPWKDIDFVRPADSRWDCERDLGPVGTAQDHRWLPLRASLPSDWAGGEIWLSVVIVPRSDRRKRSIAKTHAPLHRQANAEASAQ